MKIIEVKDYQEMSKTAANYLIKKVKNSPQLTLGLATGGTPQGVYQHMIEDHIKNGTSYTHVTSFNLDEYIGLSKDDPNSYYHYMSENLFQHININLENVNIPSGMNPDLQAECDLYESKLQSQGGIDLQLLGIGCNGHIGFNEPGTSFEAKTHIVELAPSTREANARYFSSIEEVPTQAITMGINTIFNSKEILLLVSGKAKQDAIATLLNGDVSESFPASILKQHPNVTVIVDEEALMSVKGVIN
jgi:glucosamine-6-phosphate deaminase